ncbi:major facilitator superfamily-domain-containing protein [Leptodontidium sp. MPI-SDFR-AT-0119]|nr:major facilitator superfamily-domain-containing protein [Leptodontidium sp. MPI-SDFR-AT-0119]
MAFLNTKDEVALSPPTASPGHESFLAEKDGVPQNSTPDEPIVEEGEYITGLKLFVVVCACIMATFLMLLDVSIVATAIPQITNHFHSLPDIGWYGSAYLLSCCAFQPLSGRIYNQFPTKSTYMIFIAVFEFGSLLSAVAVSSNMLIVGRAVAGIGASGLLNGGLTIIRASVPMEKTATYLGALISTAQLGILLGPLIGGSLTEYVSWRWCMFSSPFSMSITTRLYKGFYINLPVGALVILSLCFINIPDRRPPSEIKTGLQAILTSFDLPGFAIFAGTAIMLLFAVEWGGSRYPWKSAVVIGLFCGSAATLVLFLFWEHRKGEAALLPLSIIRQRIVWTSCLQTFFICANMTTTSYYMAVYFQAVRDKSPTTSGVYLLPAILSQMLFGITAGVLVTRLGYYLPWAIASGALATIGTGLLTTLAPTSSTAKWVFFQIIAGAGRGMGIQMPIVAVQNHLPPPSISLGLAFVVFSQQLGPALFLSFAQTILSATLKSKLPSAIPGIDVQTVLNTGATGFRDVVKEADVKAVVRVYSDAVDNVFVLITAASGCAFLAAWGMGWRSVKKVKEKDAVNDDVETRV